jgi:hypothetical protein
VSWIAAWRAAPPRRTAATWLLRVLSVMTFSGWVATLAGWYVTEIGRQPWLVYGVLLTRDAASTVPAPLIGISLSMYLLLYVLLLSAYVSVLFYLARKAGDPVAWPARRPGAAGHRGTVTPMPDLATPPGWLPLAFLAVMGLAMLAYVILDGYDLGVGMLLPFAGDADKDMMVASIGPFWDANETWLVLGIGVLLVAFPVAHGVILTSLYLPVAHDARRLILRGVSFDFRVKARAAHKAAGTCCSPPARQWPRCAGLHARLYIIGFEARSPRSRSPC